MVELGRRLEADGLLADPRDVFYLELEEIFGFLSGTATTTNLAGLAALRRAEFDEFRSTPAPPNRLHTRGSPYHGRQWLVPSTPFKPGRADERQGTGCSPGVVRGRARLIREPRTAQIQTGEILVAEHTDPGWILLFPAAAGLLVERGSLLSHSAIVARELGIPTVVSLDGLLSWLRDGDEIELDGGSGWVRRLHSRESGHDETPSSGIAKPVAEGIEAAAECYARS
jgi:pyruvate,water dikinase